ncbi:MAG: hypothetical protein JJU31_16935 [Wenzhouxiangella sp.]|nr:hypothetical protein [Wenzhouxiangella sp.]
MIKANAIVRLTLAACFPGFFSTAALAFEPGVYGAREPVNAEVRIRAVSDDSIRVEIIAAGPDSAGAAAPATCYAVLQASPDGDRLEAPLLPLTAPGTSVDQNQLDPDQDRLRLEAVSDGIRVHGAVSYCGLQAVVEGHYEPIDERESRLFQGCAPEPQDCWVAEQPGSANRMPEPGIYRGESPINAELRITRPEAASMRLEIVAAAADGSGARAPASCFVVAHGALADTGFNGSPGPVRAPGYLVSADQLDRERDRVEVQMRGESLEVRGQASYCSINAPFEGEYTRIDEEDSHRFRQCSPGPGPCWAAASADRETFDDLTVLFLQAPESIVPLSPARRLEVATGQRLVSHDANEGLLVVGGDAGLPGYTVRVFSGEETAMRVAVQERFAFETRTVFYQVDAFGWLDRSQEIPGYDIKRDYRLGDASGPEFEVRSADGEQRLQQLEWTGSEFREVP